MLSKKHIDQVFAMKKVADPNIKEWYLNEEIQEKFGVTQSIVHTKTSENMVPRKNVKGKTAYSKKHIDELFSSRLENPHADIKNWYNMDDIVQKYGLESGYVANLVFKNPVPKIKRGTKTFYSQTHFDELMARKRPQAEYYTVEEAMEKFKVTRDSLYRVLKLYSVPKIKIGRQIQISKTELDKIYSQILR